MPAPATDQDLPSIVLARGDRDPEEPALFYPDALEVRWRSWGALADQVAGGAAALATLGLAPGAPVAFRCRTAPDAVAADLAIQAAGLAPVPVADPAEAAAAGPAAWLLLPGEPAPAAAAAPAVELPAAPRPGRSGRRRPEREPLPAPASVGELERARRLGERLERAAADVAAAVSGGRRAPREIALASFDLRAPAGRTFLAWALLTGAALYLEPDSRALPGAAVWARPTLVAGPARSLVELAREVRRREERRPRWFQRRSGPRLPFGRLRLLLVLEEGRLPVDDVAFWAGRGVAVLRVDA